MWTLVEEEDEDDTEEKKKYLYQQCSDDVSMPSQYLQCGSTD